jgi:hypothetical protein
MMFFGSMTLGSILWGALGNQFGIATTFLIAGSGQLLSTLIISRFPLNKGGTPEGDLQVEVV